MVFALPISGVCAEGPSPAEMVERQQTAMARLDDLEGLWEGTGWLLEGETKVPLAVAIQSGKMLDGVMQLIEVRTRDGNGKIHLHGVNFIVYNTARQSYAIQAHAGGLYGDFTFNVTQDGYVWQLGDDNQGLRYTGVVHGDVWTETTERLGPGGVISPIGKFTLKRAKRSEWPAPLIERTGP
jgi:hypothetical protein